MKTVFLMRHAKSSWDSDMLNDKDRPLNNRGRHDAELMGRQIAIRGLLPQLILSSDSARTKETVNYLKTSLSDADIEYDPTLYHSSSEKLWDCALNIDNKYHSVLLLAHNPGMTDAFNKFGNVNIFNVPTAGILCLQFDVQEFSKMTEKKGRIEYYIYPKQFY